MTWWVRTKEFIRMRPYLKRTIGAIFVVYGFLALITPFTPGAWLIFIGLELIGIKLLFTQKVLAFFRARS